MSIRSVTSVWAVSTNRSAKAFARGLRGGIFTARIPALVRTGQAVAGGGSARRAPRGQPSPAVAADVCGAARRPRAAAPATRCPWTPLRAEQDQPAAKPDEDQVEQRPSPQVTGLGRLLEPGRHVTRVGVRFSKQTWPGSPPRRRGLHARQHRWRAEGRGNGHARSPSDPAAGPGEWTGLSEESVAHRAERRCSEGEEGFVEAPKREFRTPGG